MSVFRSFRELNTENIHGCFLTWGYPLSSSISRSDFPWNKNHPYGGTLLGWWLLTSYNSRAPNGDFLDQNKLPPIAPQLLVNYQSNLKWLTTFNLIYIYIYYIYMLGTIKQIQANVARVCFVFLQRCARQLKQRTRRLDFISWRTFWVGFVDHIRHLDASNTKGAQSTYTLW